MPTKRLFPLAMALTLGMAGCDRTPELDTRTFMLEHADPYQAAELIQPYVYQDRPDAPGRASATDDGLTVRETPDNLAKIERVLADYDQPRGGIRLHFQLIEADGFSDTDSSIAEVVQELRQVLQFRGYRLAGEAFLSASDRAELGQRLQAADQAYEIDGRVVWRQGALLLEGISLSSREGVLLHTTVNIRPGQTLVLGSSPKAGTGTTLLLTVRAEEVESGAD